MFFTLFAACTEPMGVISTNLRLECEDGSLLAFIAGDLPDYLRQSLLSNITDSLQPYLDEPLWRTKSAEGSVGDMDEGFFALHFQHYCRMATNVRRLTVLYLFVDICSNRAMMRHERSIPFYFAGRISHAPIMFR